MKIKTHFFRIIIKGSLMRIPDRKLRNMAHALALSVFIDFKGTNSPGELIVYPCSGVRRRCRRPPFSNVFSSEAAWPIKAKFYVVPPLEGGTKVCINGPGHMTKMAAMPIYGKNPSKIFFSRTGGRFPRNLVCSIWDSCPS